MEVHDACTPKCNSLYDCHPRSGRATQLDFKDNDLNDLIATLQAGRSLKRFPGVLPNVRAAILSSASGKIQSPRLINRWDGHKEDITDIAFSSNGHFIASASKDNTVRLWSKDGSPLGNKSLEHDSSVVAVDFSPNGDLIATGTEDGVISLWTVDGNLARRLEEQHESAITDIAFSPDGSKVASSSQDSTINIWGTDGVYQGSTPEVKIEISGINFSPDGKMIASFAKFDVVRIWDTSSLKEISNIEDSYRSIHVSFGSDNRNLNIVDSFNRLKIFSLDGKLITGNFLNSEGNLKEIKLTSTKRAYATASEDTFFDKPLSTVIVNRLGEWSGPINRFNHESGVISLALSPDGSSMVTATEDGHLHLWDVASETNDFGLTSTRRFPAIFDLEQGRVGISDSFNSVSFFNIEQSSSKETRISVSEKNRIMRLTGNVMGFSPTENLILMADSQGLIRLGKPKSSDFIPKILDDDRIIRSDLSPENSLVITTHESGNVKIWNDRAELKGTIEGHEDIIPAVVVTQDGNKIITADDTSLKIWNPDGSLTALISDLDRRKLPSSRWVGGSNGIFLSPNNQELIIIESSGTAELWSISGVFIKQLSGHSDPISNVVFSPDGSRFMTIARNFYFGGSVETRLWGNDGSLIREVGSVFGHLSDAWFHPSGDEIFAAFGFSSASIIERISLSNKIISPLEGHIGHITDHSFSPDGKMLATSSADNTIIVWDLETDKRIYLRGHNSSVSKVSFADKDKKLASVDDEGIIKFWSPQGQELNSFDMYSKKYSADKGGANSLEFIENDEYLLLSNQIYTTLLDANGTEIETFKTFQTHQLNFSKEHTMIAVEKPELKVIDADGNIVATLTGHSDLINSAVFSPDGKTIASASKDNTVILWDNDGNRLKTIQHEDGVNSVSFSSDGKWLATAGQNGIVRIFDQKGNQIKNKQGQPIELSEHTDSVTSVLFSPDHKHLASASVDRTIRLWDVRTWQQDGKEFDILSSSPSGGTNIQELDSLWFSKDDNLLAYGTNPVYIRLLAPWWQNRLSINELYFDPIKDIPRELPDKRQWITVKGNKGVRVLSFGLDHSMQEACEWVGDHLRLNANERDAHLCHGILGEN